MAVLVGNASPSTCAEGEAALCLSEISDSDFDNDLDLLHEEELKRNPFAFKLWWSYLEVKQGAPFKFRCFLYERALKVMPRSYKLWWNYLEEWIKHAKNECVTSKVYAMVNEVFERCLIHQSKMPMIWIKFTDVLCKQKLVTRTRRTFDRALTSLPLTQHAIIWDKYISFIQKAAVDSTARKVFRRYLMLLPEHVEVYIAYLLSVGDYDEASARLADIVNKEDFVSMEGKSRHELWLDLCEIISQHPKEVKSVAIEPVLRGGIAKFTDQVGKLWNSLAKYYILLGKLEKARDIFEEAIASVGTLQDFTLVFDAYLLFIEGLVTRQAEADASRAKRKKRVDVANEGEVELQFCRLEELLARRPFLVSSVKLRQNPHNIHEWINRTKLMVDDPVKVIRTFAEALKSVDPLKAVGKVHALWILFARFYEEHGDIDNAERVLERASQSVFRGIDDLASIWCEWIEMELRHERYDLALEVGRRAINKPRVGANHASDAVQYRLHRSVKLWSICVDVEESLGTLDSLRACVDKMFDAKAITPQIVLNCASIFEEKQYFEESFRVYERAIAIFNWPHISDIWMTYLWKFTDRYEGKKLERTRELYEQVLADVPEKYARRFYMMYALLEEKYGLARRALKIYHRATSAVEPAEMLNMYFLYIAKTIELLGVLQARGIFAEAIERLPSDSDVRDICMRYARIERSLCEIDRARGVLEHASQFCDPRRDTEFWTQWREFEVAHGSETTFRNMLRIKRSVQAQFTHVHFNLAESGSAMGLDPMASLEEQQQSVVQKPTTDPQPPSATTSEGTQKQLQESDEVSMAEAEKEFLAFQSKSAN